MPAKVDIAFHRERLTPAEKLVVSEGFRTHSAEQDAPDYQKDSVKWLALDEHDEIKGVLSADILWDWVYIDELWVSPTLRGQGLGQELMELAEEFARSQGHAGVWLWTQSWQADGFYRRLGYDEFTRFDNFPRGHSRIGFRKKLD